METIIQIQHLQKHFGNLKVLNDVDFDIHKGEVVTIIGSSGSGKSTMLRCVNLLERMDGGHVLYHGKDILSGQMDVNEYRSKVGMVFQSFNLFNNLNVMDNIILAPVKLGIYSEKEAKKKAIDYLKRIDLLDKVAVYPNSLSGGQKQRVAIIRTLMMKPEVILFDEPTSALDPEMVREVQDMMIELANEGMTMVVVTHEVSFVKKVATKIVFMNEGRIILTGSYDEIVNSDNEMVKLFLSNIK